MECESRKAEGKPERTGMTEQEKQFLLLQINDALFPIGGYSHSYGLETYIQKELVSDEESAAEYIRNNLRFSVCFNELLLARLAYEAAAQDSENALHELLVLEELAAASRSTEEVRRAGEKMGSRFIKTAGMLPVPMDKKIFARYAKAEGSKTHAAAYGVFCAAAGIDEDRMLEHYLYSLTSAMVTNCVKTIPLSQTAGQKLLFACREIWPAVTEQVKQLTLEDYGACTPGFEVRCMQHEGLYSRLFMS